MDREVWHASLHGVTKSQIRLSNWTELKPKNTWSHQKLEGQGRILLWSILSAPWVWTSCLMCWKGINFSYLNNQVALLCCSNPRKLIHRVTCGLKYAAAVSALLFFCHVCKNIFWIAHWFKDEDGTAPDTTCILKPSTAHLSLSYLQRYEWEVTLF